MSTPASLLHSAPETAPGLPPSALGEPAAWKAELNARLRQHRARRAESAAEIAAPVPAHHVGTNGAHRYADLRPEGTPASRVAARVAERYSQAPSYKELLTASALAAAVAADTAAAAALEAHAAAEAALSDWHMHQASPRSAEETARAESAGSLSFPSDCAFALSADPFADPFFSDTPRLALAAEPCAAPFPTAESGVAASARPAPFATTVEHHAPLPERSLPPARLAMAERARSLVDAFAEAVVPAAQSLPAKLIEFPRELIAPRKQRPRLAEGPLFEETASMALRIFEVPASPEGTPGQSAVTRADVQHYGAKASVFNAAAQPPAHIYSAMASEHEDEMPRRRTGFPDAADASARPAPADREHPSSRREQPARQESGWGTIRLGEHPQAEAAAPPAQPAARRPEHGYRVESEPSLHDLAPISDRLMGALVDGGIVLACFLLSVLVFASCTPHPPAGKAAFAVGFLVFGAMASFYGWLFMSYGGGSTPGMRYAHIALCTFADDNPTRKDLQNRVPATALALLPLGLGVLWALLDEDKLGWHDRMTRTYQRSYR